MVIDNASGRTARHVRELTWYIRLRFPPATQGVATLATFSALHILARSTGATFDARIVLAAAGFCLLLFHLRTVDDLDDFRRDVEAGRDPGVSSRGRLRAWCAGSAVLVVALSATASPPLLLAAVLAMLLAGVAPRVGRWRHGARHPVVLFSAYESAPAMIMLYAALGPTASGAPARWPYAILAAVPFWCGYEVWKFSRRLDRPDYRPYGLGSTGQILSSALLLALATAAGIALVLLFGPPPELSVCLVAVPFAFLGWVAFWRQRASPPRRAPAWAGLTFATVLTASFVLAAGIAAVFRYQ